MSGRRPSKPSKLTPAARPAPAEAVGVGACRWCPLARELERQQNLARSLRVRLDAYAAEIVRLGARVPWGELKEVP